MLDFVVSWNSLTGNYGSREFFLDTAGLRPWGARSTAAAAVGSATAAARERLA